ncbi:MAG: hypothetical protein NWF05_00525 [Candidatus Bathyarchaeota archaeon]|nr:hypothetical protein [Candidatus Bathyarchaeota archaeon]
MSKMGTTRMPLNYKGRTLGVLVLVAVQLLIGFVHVGFGFWLLSAQDTLAFLGSPSSTAIYSIYTISFGASTLLFTTGLWLQKSWGWLGTVAVALFIIIADSLTLLALPSIPGIPKVAGLGEIPYSILLMLYLLTPQIRKQYLTRKN